MTSTPSSTSAWTTSACSPAPPRTCATIGAVGSDAATANAVVIASQTIPPAARGHWRMESRRNPARRREGKSISITRANERVLRFFDNPPATRSCTLYYTIFGNEWKSTPEFPPAGFDLRPILSNSQSRTLL
ncbi:MAG: hypothetical protein IPJ47_18680 [Anaerolineales bacterium]|nr:hypothetical protein [Anaerolineales bacterium]